MRIEIKGIVYESMIAVEHGFHRARILRSNSDCWMVVVTDFSIETSKVIRCISEEHAIQIFHWCIRPWLEELLVN